MALAPSDAQSIFLAAVEQAAAGRPAFLDRACGDDVALRRRVEALLQAHEEPGSFFDPAADRGAAAVDEPPVRRPRHGHRLVQAEFPGTRRRAQVPLRARVPQHPGSGARIPVRFRAVLRS